MIKSSYTEEGQIIIDNLQATLPKYQTDLYIKFGGAKMMVLIALRAKLQVMGVW